VQVRDAAVTVDAQFDLQVGRGKVRLRLLGPFDQTDAITGKVFIEARIQIFFSLIEPIKIKVIEVYSRNQMNFNQSVGGAFHRTGYTTCAEERANYLSFSGAQVAIEPDHQPALHKRCQQVAKRYRGAIVGQG
jgi:hypothetical protein